MDDEVVAKVLKAILEAIEDLHETVGKDANDLDTFLRRTHRRNRRDAITEVERVNGR